ncbi:hypothetical protein [Phycobacter sp. K97]|uniref:hypothetical protein n=1 Tax=Phycobacter sedimenti TaxID=3133977 RepID=UPI00311FDF30
MTTATTISGTAASMASTAIASPAAMATATTVPSTTAAVAATVSGAITAVAAASKTTCVGGRAQFAMRAARHSAVHFILTGGSFRSGLIDVVELFLHFVILLRPRVCMR